MKGRLAINLEYGALRVFCALLNALPYALAMALARALGWALSTCLGFKQARTRARIRTVFPKKTPSEVRRIACRSLQNILMNGVEMMRAPSLDQAWMDRHVKDGRLYKDRLQALVDEGRGVVIMVPHTGNWYMAAWSMAQYGLGLFALAARQRNPKLNAWMHRHYGAIDILYRDSRETLVKIKDFLREGRAFAMLPDLRVRHRDVQVPFLNGTANVSHSGAMFAVRCRAPLVVAAMSREKGRHVFRHLATLRADPGAANPREEAVRLTREAMRLLDADIQAHPHDWFWYNKSWILEPVKG